jgi:hypothetical protein
VRRPGLRLFDLVREKVSTSGSWGAPVTIKGPGGSGRRALHDAFVSGEDRFECDEIEQAMRAHGHNNVGPPLAPDD